MTDTPLSPCPICGGAPVRNGRGTSGGVLCWGKDVPGLMHRLQVYGDGQADADATWNHRAAAGDIEAMIDRALNAEIRTNGFSWTLQELFNDRASRSTLNQTNMRNAMRQILALGATSTRQTPDAVREAVALTIADAGYHLRKYRPHCLEALEKALAALDSRVGDAGEAIGYQVRIAYGEWHPALCSEAEAARMVANVDGAVCEMRPVYAATPAPAVDAQSMSIAIAAGPARDAVADLEQFLTDHSGNEETGEGMEAEDRAHKAMRFVRRVICAAMGLCDGATDDCTAGCIVTVDGDDFDQLNAALDAVAPAVDAVPAGGDYKTAFEQLAGGLAWMHDCPGLSAYWGKPLADIVNDLIDRAYPNLRNGISRP